MMVLDTSAIIAILLHEPEEPRLKASIRQAKSLYVGAPSVLEASMVMVGRLGTAGIEEVEQLIAVLSIRVVPFTNQHLSVAQTAFLTYGKGRHPARLNFGDCIAYAIAKASALPLLFVGNDFAQTDVTPA